MNPVLRQAITALNDAAEEVGFDTPDGRALVEAAHSLKLHQAARDRQAATRHLVGDVGTLLRSTPDLGRVSSRVRTASLTADDKQAIVAEVGAASNSHKLDLAGTHYEMGSEFDLEWWLGV